jgi:Sulfotransferase family
MQNGIHFISGLPRSGSTLLAAILRRTPQPRSDPAPAGGAATTGPRDVFTGLAERRVADGVGFEPTVSLHPRRFSRPVP